MIISSQRGCGTREEGGLYGESESSPDGKPPEHFLFDPPVVVDFSPKGLDLPAIGQKIIAQPCYGCNGLGVVYGEQSPLSMKEAIETVVRELVEPTVKNGPQVCNRCKGEKNLHHIADRIGLSHYPTVPHFVEEIRYLGASRRLNPKGDYSKLKPGVSRFMFAHDLAVIQDYRAYWNNEPSKSVMYVPRCPKNKEEHYLGSEYCIRYLWQDLFTERYKETPPGLYSVGPFNEEITIDVKAGTRQRIVTLPCGGPFYALTPPESVDRAGRKSYYTPAFFMWLPISRLVVVRDKKKGTHEKTAERHSKGSIPVEIVDN